MDIPIINIESVLEREYTEPPLISPSKYIYLKNGCMANECFQRRLRKIKGAALLPGFNTKALVGTVLHELMRRFSTSFHIDMDEFVQSAEILFEEERDRRFQGWPMVIKNNIKINYEEIYNLYAELTIGRNYVDKELNDKVKTKTYNEFQLDCPNLGLKGKIDQLVLRGDNGVLKDYKSGKIKDNEGNIKEDYVVQLSLYRLMVLDKFKNLMEVKLVLEDFSSNQEEVTPIPSDSLLPDVEKTRGEILESLGRMSDESIYLPGDNCRYCNTKHICKNCNWQDPEEKEYFDFRGVLAVKGDRICLFDERRDVILEVVPNRVNSDLFKSLIEFQGELVYIGNLQLIKKDCSRRIGRTTDWTIAAVLQSMPS